MLALENVQTMYAAISSAEASRRFNTYLISVFAAAALLLAVTGIYAVVAFSFSLRSQEIAIRVALGAQRSSIANLVLLSGARMALVGCVIGVLGSLAASRMVNSFLFGVSATDPWAFGLAVLCMMITALLASSIPAMRAVRVDPISALKSN
jgi:ABC-type antimicrobial peptide transport system permease subunit